VVPPIFSRCEDGELEDFGGVIGQYGAISPVKVGDGAARETDGPSSATFSEHVDVSEGTVRGHMGERGRNDIRMDTSDAHTSRFWGESTHITFEGIPTHRGEPRRSPGAEAGTHRKPPVESSLPGPSANVREAIARLGGEVAEFVAFTGSVPEPGRPVGGLVNHYQAAAAAAAAAEEATKRTAAEAGLPGRETAKARITNAGTAQRPVPRQSRLPRPFSLPGVRGDGHPHHGYDLQAPSLRAELRAGGVETRFARWAPNARLRTLGSLPVPPIDSTPMSEL
jgi:hypothetical protein